MRCGYPSEPAQALHCGTCASTPPAVSAARPGLRAGFRAFFRGVGVLLARPRTKRFAVIPLLLSFVAFGVVFGLLWAGTADLRAHAASASWMPQWLQSVTSGVLATLTVAIFGAFAWFTATPITQALAAPFLDWLVARVDEERLGRAPALSGSWAASTAFSIAQALLSLAVSLSLSLAAFAAAFIPFLGFVLAPLLLALALGFAAIDIAASRRRWTLSQKLSLLTARPAPWIGFGLAAVILALIPCLTILLGIPAMALGGTLLLYEVDLSPARRLHKP